LKKPIVLRIYKGEQLFGVKQFTDEQVVIGRQPEAQVTLIDDRVSVIHALIEEREGQYFLCDLGSETGTKKNGEAVLDVRIESGDVVEIANFRIEFYVGVPKPKMAPPSHTITGINHTITQIPSGGEILVEKNTSSLSSPTVSGPDLNSDDNLRSADDPPAPVEHASLASLGQLRPPAPTEHRPPPITPPPIESDLGADTTASLLTRSKITSPGLPPTLRTTTNPSIKKRIPTKPRTKGGTFAPPSKYQSYREFVKPSKGTVVEILVLWRERVINAYHFSGRATITMGSKADCDVVLPLAVTRHEKMPLVRIDARAILLLSPEVRGELIKGQQSQTFSDLIRQNRMSREAEQFALVLEQGEMVRLEMTDQVSVIIRYTSDSPKPLVAPLLDLSAAEFTGVVMAFVLVGILGLYMYLYSPPTGLPDDLTDEPMRIATVEVQRPEATPAPTPVPEPVPVAVATPQPTPPPATPPPATPKKLADQETPKQTRAQNPDPRPDKGAASNVAANRNDKNAPKQQTSIKQGGGLKTNDKEGGQAKSPRKDPTKTGVFSVFGSGGRQDRQDRSYVGSDALTGFAEATTGKAGQSQNRPGDGLGSPLKDTGRGGSGTAAVGVADVRTQGRGSGNTGYGVGGLGQQKTGVRVVPGGNEAVFSSGSIDREAIRRAIQSNLRAIRTCYERQLNRQPDLFGKLIMEWVIAEQGRVRSVRVKSSEIGDPRVGECVGGVIRTIRFPEPPTNEEVTVSYPFFFSS